MTDLNEAIRMIILGCLFLAAAFSTPLFFLQRDKGGMKFHSIWTLILMIITIVALSAIGTLIIVLSLSQYLAEGV